MKGIIVRKIDPDSDNDFKVGNVMCVDRRGSLYGSDLSCYEIIQVDSEGRKCHIRALYPAKRHSEGDPFYYTWSAMRENLKFVLSKEDRTYKLGISLLCLSLTYDFKEEVQNLLVEVGI